MEEKLIGCFLCNIRNICQGNAIALPLIFLRISRLVVAHPSSINITTLEVTIHVNGVNVPCIAKWLQTYINYFRTTDRVTDTDLNYFRINYGVTDTDLALLFPFFGYRHVSPNYCWKPHPNPRSPFGISLAPPVINWEVCSQVCNEVLH